MIFPPSSAFRSAVSPLAARAPRRGDVDVGPHPTPPVQGAVTGYYVVAEALANVVRHSGADRVRIRLRRRDDRLVLTITDDGMGGAALSRGTGLQGLADRVEAVGGRLVVVSPPGEGTTLEVTLPCA